MVIIFYGVNHGLLEISIIAITMWIFTNGNEWCHKKIIKEKILHNYLNTLKQYFS